MTKIERQILTNQAAIMKALRFPSSSDVFFRVLGDEISKTKQLLKDNPTNTEQ